MPKTGSSSVRAVLGKSPKPHLNLCEIKKLMETCWTREAGGDSRILEYLYLTRSRKRRIEIGKKQFNAYFKFGFVRNPWDRVVSLYERKEPLQMKDKMTFEEFVDWIQYSSSTCIHSSPIDISSTGSWTAVEMSWPISLEDSRDSRRIGHSSRKNSALPNPCRIGEPIRGRVTTPSTTTRTRERSSRTSLE